MDSFEWRVSIATIAQSGPFSVFAGVDRVIVLLDGDGVHLQSAGGICTTGSTKPSSRSPSPARRHWTARCWVAPSQDFNVMTRRSALRAEVAVLRDATTSRRRPRTAVQAAATGSCSPTGPRRTAPAPVRAWWDGEPHGWQVKPQDANAAVLVGALGRLRSRNFMENMPDPSVKRPEAPAATQVIADLPFADGVWEHLRPMPGALEGTEAAAGEVSLVVADGRVAWIGAGEAVPALHAGLPRVDGGGALLSPGLIDCHTHLVYGGDRAHEFELRLNGASYEEIARAGGGIASTVRGYPRGRATRVARRSRQRLRQLAGRGRDHHRDQVRLRPGAGHERKQLRVARRLGEASWRHGAHHLPRRPRRAARVRRAQPTTTSTRCAGRCCPRLAAEGLVDAVDAFCERIGFIAGARPDSVFEAARALGLPVKLHADQLTDMGGAALAARFGAPVGDHLEHLGTRRLAAMTAAGTVAVLLPGAYYTLRETHLPPIEALRDTGVPMAVSTDHNPGTSPALSLLLMANMACTLFRLTAARGAGRHHPPRRSRAGLVGPQGVLTVGRPADFVLWECTTPPNWPTGSASARPAPWCARVAWRSTPWAWPCPRRPAMLDAAPVNRLFAADALLPTGWALQRAARPGIRTASSRTSPPTACDPRGSPRWTAR